MGIRPMIQRESVGSIFTTVSMLVSAPSSGAKRVLESQVEPLTMTSAAAYQPCKATKGVQDRTLQMRQRTMKHNCFAEMQLVTVAAV